MSMTKEQALEKSKWWHDLHEEANAEEAAGCHGMAERLRNDALDVERELRAVGFNVMDFYSA